MLNRFKIDEFFLSNICLTSVEELLNPQSFHRLQYFDNYFEADGTMPYPPCPLKLNKVSNIHKMTNFFCR